eukprot:9493143-Pyramimonas_sp.AAC.1
MATNRVRSEKQLSNAAGSCCSKKSRIRLPLKFPSSGSHVPAYLDSCTPPNVAAASVIKTGIDRAGNVFV